MEKNIYSVFRISLLYLLFIQVSAKAQNMGGNDFWFTFPQNYQFAQPNPGQNQLVLVSGCNVSGKVEFPALGGAAIPFTVTPGTATIVNLAANNNNVAEVVQNNGLHITCDNLVSAYAVDYLPFTVDGETIMPTSKLGTDYVIMGYSSNNLYTPSQFTVCATEDNTTVTITTSKNTTVSGTTVSHVAGSTWNVVLNKGQTYMVTAYASGSVTSLTGTRVKGSKPIFVISHTACTNYVCASCDMLMCAELPTSLWGKKYVTAQAQARNMTGGTMADYLEIVAGPLGANVTINRWSGNTTVALGAYQSTLYINPKGAAPDPGEANTIITADNIIQVSQYSQGAGCDGSANTDPEHVVIYPENTWISDYTFSCSTTLTSVAAGITIVTSNAGTTSMMIDGAAIPAAGWKAIGTGGYKYLRMAVAVGPHHIYNSSNIPFSFYQYAFGSDESYIVQGGASYTNCTMLSVPLEFLSFSGRYVNGRNELTWEGINEQGISFFEIEKSYDGNKFTTIGRLEKNRNGKRYFWRDLTENKNADCYYRLKEVKENKSVVYSDVLVIKNISDLSGKISEIKLLENKKMEISFSSKAGKNSLRLVDMSMRTIQSIESENENAEQSVIMDISSVSPGLYILLLESGTSVVSTEKVLIR